MLGREKPRVKAETRSLLKVLQWQRVKKMERHPSTAFQENPQDWEWGGMGSGSGGLHSSQAHERHRESGKTQNM